ncbi:MAG: hypothetical protein ACFFAN_05775 [Promethearchaeota archaeon]
MTIIKDEIGQIELFETVVIECPKCHKQKKLKVPVKIINQSKSLTTVSIPLGLSCEHSFQAFIDKKFKIRGYQMVDFDFSRMEIYEGTIGTNTMEADEDLISALEEDQKAEEKLLNLNSLPLFQDIIKLLRGIVDDREILGSGIFTIDGHVLYSSLPQGALTNTIREFEVRSEKKLVNLKKMFLELENNQKICSKYMEIEEMKFVLVLFFSEKVKLGMGNLYLRELSKKINSFN